MTLGSRHLTISTQEKAVGGHLEKGYTVFTLAEVVIMKLEDSWRI